MRVRKKLRWIKRRENTKLSWGARPYEILDLTVLVSIIALTIFILRISFIYAATQSPTRKAFHDFGKSLGLESVFALGLFLASLLALMWGLVSIVRFPKIKQSKAYFSWHVFIFVGIGLLTYGAFLAVNF